MKGSEGVDHVSLIIPQASFPAKKVQAQGNEISFR
jgi:hypothetical protein